LPATPFLFILTWKNYVRSRDAMKAPLPLNAINAFAAAGRHGSFLIAARDLGVTPAAVSQLVRKLEAHLGKTLFQRLNNRILLTDAGKSLLQAVSPALDELAEAAQSASRSGARRKLRVSAVPSLAECWLIPLLPRFFSAHPRLRIDLSVEEESRPGAFDLRINYGRLPDEDLVQEDLCHDVAVPVAAPGFGMDEGNTSFTAALSPRLIHTQWGPSYGSNVTWKDWFQHVAPRERIDMAAGHDVNASRAALALAETGAGIALGQRLLAGQALAEGRLVRLSESELPLGQSYVIAITTARQHQPDVQAFRTWLLAEVTAQPAPQDLRPHPPATPTRRVRRSASHRHGRRPLPRSE
jgi:LysR family transcriptional regulator, glycine cleavage system transcriptional activator